MGIKVEVKVKTEPVGNSGISAVAKLFQCCSMEVATHVLLYSIEYSSPRVFNTFRLNTCEMDLKWVDPPGVMACPALHKALR